MCFSAIKDEINSQIESMNYLKEHPEIALNTINQETQEYCRGAINILRYLQEWIKNNEEMSNVEEISMKEKTNKKAINATNTTNNATIIKEENKMKKAVEINTKVNEKNVVEFIKTIKANGTGFCTPVIDGEEMPMLGFFYTSESDYESGANFVKEAVLATNGNMSKIMNYIITAKNVLEADVNPDEEIEIKGYKLMLSYEDKKIYDCELNVIAECSDLNNLPNEAIKAVLIAKAELNLTVEETKEDYDDYDDDEEYYED